ncbi:hypothetical protein ITP53_04885 [Nonomuraea sp. K274]|uniref:Integral membrane protein n=1 Tax=Nonomuraea cypriaca TaxID=1187855 RepID=A0A931A7Y7_9ACTN|nr:hypothetical protein [Nonomuraea cypriaca]MBF8185084.1 hypothetical protein [Nonomuraea cypriaca]
MDGFIDETRGGVTELRVHGASGASPAGMLNHPDPRLVAGDGTTGFYRRWWAGGRPEGAEADVPGIRHREAYAWGGLTSGGRTIALWLLLLPFALANLSYFMLPRPAGGRRLRHVVEAAQRLFALLLTGTLVGAVTRAGVDLIGWQCTAAGRACTHETAPVWVRWLGVLWGEEPSKRLAVTALVPLLLVVLLWWIARRTWRRDERTVIPPTTPPDGAERGGSPLARPRLWHGGAPVWRLRVVHVCFAIASIGLAVSAPFAHSPQGFVLTVANTYVQLAAAVLVVLPATARRLDPHSGTRDPGWLTLACKVLRVAAPLVFVATFAAGLAGMPAGGSARQLPGVGIGAFQFVLMLVLGLFILVATCVLARMDRPRGERDPIERRAMHGVAAWFVLMVAAGSANVLALGVLFWTATFFGEPGTSAEAEPIGRKLFLDDPVWWTAALVPIIAVGLLAVAFVLYLIQRAEAGRLAAALEPHYGERHAAAVAAKWALAALTDRAGLVLAVLTGIGVAGFGGVTVFYRFGVPAPDDGLTGLLATTGSWAMIAAVAGLVLLGRRTHSDLRLRRTIGILWDVSTFWPRAIHPLSPPCYTERVIPEMVARFGELAPAEGDQVVLSGHSQGSVIAAALVPQLEPELRGRVRLLTHGSPLRRLYAAYFPAYFGARGLAAVREGATWCNLYRLSDPIGGPVFRHADPLAAGPVATDAVDRFCWDPPRPGPGEPLGQTRWHAAYWDDPAYDETLARLTTVKRTG